MSSFKALYPDDEFFSKDIKIIDIRTKGEWVDTGVVENSHAITFFDDYGKYDLDGFVSDLNKIVAKDEEFALICRSGSRTRMVGQMLASDFGYKVISLDGGIYFASNNVGSLKMVAYLD
jgi:rhodanese-related sulfurtransferase